MRTHTYYFIIYDLYQNRLTFYFRSFDLTYTIFIYHPKIKYVCIIII